MEKSERENNTSSESGQEMQVKPEFCDLKPEAGLTLAHLSFIRVDVNYLCSILWN